MTKKTKTELEADLAENFGGDDTGIHNTAFRAHIGDVIDSATTDYMGFTDEGGLYIRLINDTGANSVKGTVVCVGSVTKSFDVISANAVDPIGIVYEEGVADGELCQIVIAGIVQVLLENDSAATIDYWVKVSDTDAGRADASNIMPPGGTITALEDHFSELGHALESVTAGTDKLCWIKLHFN